MTEPDEIVERVFSALLRGELARDDLGARRISTWLGQSTMGLYHHFGSLDGFLIRVDGAGWRHLLGLLAGRQRRGASLEALALAYVAFAQEHPALYWLMAERPFDRARLRTKGRLRQERELLDAFGALLARAGVSQPERYTVLVFAALHGIASLAIGGRFDLGAERSARGRLKAAVRDLVRRLPRRPSRDQ